LAEGTIADLITRNAGANVVGRAAELDRLVRERAVVCFVHGLSGIGKTALLQALAGRLAGQGVTVASIDGNDVEPTPDGMITALAAEARSADASIDAIRATLGRIDGPVVLLIDSYDALGLVDTWLRREFVPVLPDNVRLVVASRLPPGPRWTEAVEWRGLVGDLPLGPLPDDAARAMLDRLAVPPAEIDRVVALAGGIPVALALAGGAGAPGGADDGGTGGPLPPDRLMATLARRFLDGLETPGLREAVQATSVVRRVTRTLLAALVSDASPETLFARLRSLPFCSLESDGLRLHDAVREAVAADLRATDPERYGRYRRIAWRQLDTELRKSGRQDLWRYTADLIYLVSNPICRDAFFPPGASALAVEAARPEHADAIRSLARTHESEEAAALVELWLAHAFDAFHVVVDPRGAVVGFHCLYEAGRLPPRLAVEDPVAAAWRAHLDRHPVKGTETALFLRRWLSAEAGEAPSPPQAASWLDIKRAYLERRPALRRVYLALEDPAPYAEAAATLGFEPLEGGPVAVGPSRVHGAVLDMGPESVEGWLSGVVAAELGLRPRSLIDASRRGLSLGDRFVPLTPREYEVMSFLESRDGRVATRDEMLRAVWGQHHDGGSNVVDAVITVLRRKLGDHAGRIETVRGHGYLYRAAETD